ncbi:MAG: hypothetical protein HXS46_02480 [Theionarchaea archaeon]|nr:hypothetical protein [Theionarchaea archaeon]
MNNQKKGKISWIDVVAIIIAVLESLFIPFILLIIVVILVVVFFRAMFL